MSAIAFLWWQGEAETREGTDYDEYFKGFDKVASRLEEEFSRAALMVSISSMRQALTSDPVRRAQVGVARDRDFVIVGPDTDELGPESRWDGTHLSASDVDAAARLWADRVLEHLEHLEHLE